MSSLTRMLSILDLFDLDQPSWTTDQIAERTGFTRPTTFRYLKELRQSGLLARFAGGYVLGPKAVKLDYIIRQSDPLLHLLNPILASLAEETECDVILASMLGDDFFATLHIESGNTTVSWPRGRPMPLHRGAGGLAVLASLPAAKANKLLTKFADEDAQDETRAQIKQVQKQGYALSIGALDGENVGVAVDVKLGTAPASALVLVMSRKRFATSDIDTIVALLCACRQRLLQACEIADDDTAD